MTDTSFLDTMLKDAAAAPPFEPNAFYNVDGDCIEFRATDESFYAERVDSRLTVFYGQESGEMVGAVMPKKKAAPVPEPVLFSKLIKWPQDWIDRIDSTRGDVPFSEFVRQAVADKIGTEGLSEMPGWGTGRWKDKKD